MWFWSPTTLTKKEVHTPRSPWLCPRVPLNRAMVSQSAKAEALGIPDDRFLDTKSNQTRSQKKNDAVMKTQNYAFQLTSKLQSQQQTRKQFSKGGGGRGEALTYVSPCLLLDFL